MQSTAKLAVSMVLLTYALATAYQNSLKLRRDGVLNLYPFPRVGRASHRSWQLPLSLNELRSEMSQENIETKKRQLYAFPRVGRAGLLESEESEDRPGMWFGPRLGRAVKNLDDETSFENYNKEKSDPEQVETEAHFERKKRQTKPL